MFSDDGNLNIKINMENSDASPMIFLHASKTVPSYMVKESSGIVYIYNKSFKRMYERPEHLSKLYCNTHATKKMKISSFQTFSSVFHIGTCIKSQTCKAVHQSEI